MEQDEIANQMTADAFAALEAELQDLETNARAEMAERIKTARAWGDLKENSEYHDAKDSQAHLETKIARLRERRRNAVIVDAKAVTATGAGLGSVVTVKDVATGRESKHTIVSANEANPVKGLTSIASPLGRALVGTNVGDEVALATPKGERRVTVLSVE